MGGRQAPGEVRKAWRAIKCMVAGLFCYFLFQIHVFLHPEPQSSPVPM